MKEPVSRFPQSSEELSSFLDAHIGRLTRLAHNVLGNRADADDAVQEAVIRAYHMRKRLVSVTNPIGYMFRMVNNGCIDMLRRRNAYENRVAGMQHVIGTGSAEPREDGLIREEEQQRLRLLLDLLPPEQAEVIRFRFAGDLTFGEIAGIVGAPVTTVKSRFGYGMMKLRSMMKKSKEVSHEL
ncbi:MAG: RNA polymerase sigma factor [Bacteroidota bacterium]